jgi:hypothetical protein
MYTDKWTLVKRRGQPVPRRESVPTPCYKCPKIPAGAEPRPENAVELSARNAKAYMLYLETKAGRPVPDDPILWRNNGLLRQLEDAIQLSFLRQPVGLKEAKSGNRT